MSQTKLLNYSLGIDASLEELEICLGSFDVAQNYCVVRKRKFSNTPGGFKDLDAWLIKYHADKTVELRITMEATGVYHERLAYFLHEKGYHVSVLVPTKSKYYLRSLGLNSKTDKIDARGLSQMGAQQKLPKWNPPSEQMRLLKQLTRHREALQKQITVINNQLHAVSYAAGDSEIVMSFQSETLDFLRQQVKKVDKELKEVLAKDEEICKKAEAIVESIDGLGIQTLMVMLAETNGFEYFYNQRQLTSYAGYDIVANQSGKRQGKTSISKRGNSHIRRALHLPSFGMVTHKVGQFPALHERIHKRTGMKMKGYVAIQRKLLCLIYTLWKNDTVFIKNYENETNKKESNSQNIRHCEAKAPLSGTAV